MDIEALQRELSGSESREWSNEDREDSHDDGYDDYDYGRR
ncbi:hypothetical protein HNR68_000892 [Saccharopolyspora hordei]|uniref:Uncharacterized protein n=2 Tax=Saccharopolyspora hordei TaxID=1838 RepID=A0A853ACS1_9PSEU|nr:hypothetical protein [Saccharopolyspora hordei]